MKKEIKDMRDKFFFKEPEEIFLDMKKTAPAVKMLVRHSPRNSHHASAAEEKEKESGRFLGHGTFCVKDPGGSDNPKSRRRLRMSSRRCLMRS